MQATQRLSELRSSSLVDSGLLWPQAMARRPKARRLKTYEGTRARMIGPPRLSPAVRTPHATSRPLNDPMILAGATLGGTGWWIAHRPRLQWRGRTPTAALLPIPRGRVPRKRTRLVPGAVGGAFH